MKNQYFADVNDYRKYGMLRILAGGGRLKTAVCWMLTGSDTRSDGQKIGYLSKPGEWRHYDPALFDSLAACLKHPTGRRVEWAEETDLIRGAVYFPKLLTPGRDARLEYFADFHTLSQSCDLVFFDPDNGIEVKSVSINSINASKYVFWPELVHAFSQGKSILIYQHFIREERGSFTRRIAGEICARLHVSDIFTLATSHVLFLLVPQPRHRDYLTERCVEISQKWAPQIKSKRAFPSDDRPGQMEA